MKFVQRTFLTTLLASAVLVTPAAWAFQTKGKTSESTIKLGDKLRGAGFAPLFGAVLDTKAGSMMINGTGGSATVDEILLISDDVDGAFSSTCTPQDVEIAWVRGVASDASDQAPITGMQAVIDSCGVDPAINLAAPVNPLVNATQIRVAAVNPLVNATQIRMINENNVLYYVDTKAPDSVLFVYRSKNGANQAGDVDETPSERGGSSPWGTVVVKSSSESSDFVVVECYAALKGCLAY